MSNEAIQRKRHSFSHMLASAVKQEIPEAVLGIGPATDDGCYYDFLLPEGKSFSPEVLESVEGRLKKLLQKDVPFEQRDMEFEEARAFFANEKFKVELINDLEQEGETSVSTYNNSEFVDLCAGPHVQMVKELRSLAWKLDRVAGAYWKGSEKNPMLQRIYVLVFEDEKQLKEYINAREEAARRDHRRLGKELELFAMSDLVGRGLPLLLPKGATIKRILQRYVVDEELKRGYLHVESPALGRKEMYEISGHWAHYKDSMYPVLELNDDAYVLRPMTCPHHFMIFNSRPRSYRELPMRLAEVATLYRKELSGDLSGLSRMMSFNLADAHVVCTKEQVGDEFKLAVSLVDDIMKTLGVDSIVSYRASLRDDNKEKYADNREMWENAEATLIRMMHELEIDFEEVKGDAAFYGPKLDIQMKTTLGKEETVFTVQIDFVLASRFNMEFINSEGRAECPVIVHRSSIGCLERTLAFLIEFYEGAFPLWLAPIQAQILTISDTFNEFGNSLLNRLRQAGLRAEGDFRSDKIGKKIREARMQRIPYLLIVGANEVESNTVTVRNRDSRAQCQLPVEELIEKMGNEDSSKLLKLKIAA